MDRNLKRILITVLVVALIAVVTYVSYARPTPAKGAEIRVETTSTYGSVLVVDRGELGGFPLYEFSGDAPGRLGCGTKKAPGYDFDPDARVTLSCTGPKDNMIEGVTSDDWPAFTTKAKPVAGPGVDQKLLGTVYRKGIGEQVTYGGHPLYLFDPSSSPLRPRGVDYVETVDPLAPWHGYWFLVSSENGRPVSGVATVEPGTLSNGTRVLAVEGDPNVDPFPITVYTFSRDRTDARTCTGSCALNWVPVVTTAAPQVEPGIAGSTIGTFRLSDGDLQVTYDGRPLYYYARERVFLRPKGGIVTTGTAGNGNGLSGPSGGTFSTVTLP